MGSISLEQLLSESFGDPNDAQPISPLGFPAEGHAMRVGFESGASGALVFEGETGVDVRLCERVWSFRQEPNTNDLRHSRRWRLEFGIRPSEGCPIRPGHVAVVAQQPYANGWLHRAVFKRYSKKSNDDRPDLIVPILPEGTDPVDWLEGNAPFDQWEKGSRIIAGISNPHGFFADQPRNTSGDLVLGACPDFDHCVNSLLDSPEIKHLLQLTREGRLPFWKRDVVSTPPRLYPEVIEESPEIMGISVQQSLAGPRRLSERWIGDPVWKLVDLIYRDHLNESNRRAHRRRARNQPGDWCRQ